MMRALVVTDMHLMKLHFIPNGNDVQLRSINKTIEHARSEGIRIILVVGDVFDNPFPDQDTISKLLRLIYDNRDMKWYIIPGNHDTHSSEHTSAVLMKALSKMNWDFVRVFARPKTIRINKINVAFVPWSAKPDFSMSSCLVVCHHEFIGCDMGHGRISKTGVEPPDSTNFVVSGHIHVEQEFGRVLYPGILLQHTFGDGEERSYSFINVAMKGERVVVKRQRFPFKTPFKMRTLNAETVADLDQITNEKGVYWRILRKRPFVIPSKFLSEHPNVIKYPPVVNVVDRNDVNIEVYDAESAASIETSLEPMLENPRSRVLLKHALQDTETGS